ncbi:hypothetical protein BJX64DRAFT_284037 [Aspergillus heterothallicus]
MEQAAPDRTIKTLPERLSKYSDEYIKEVTVTVEWEVPKIFEASRTRAAGHDGKALWSPETHVVILRDPADSYNLLSTTCKEYLTANWGSAVSEDVVPQDQASQGSTARNVGIGVGILGGVVATMLGLPVSLVAAGTAAYGAWSSTRTSRPGLMDSTPDTQMLNITLFGSCVSLHFDLRGHPGRVITALEAWDGLCKAVRQAPQEGTILSDSDYDIEPISLSRLTKGLQITGHLRPTILSKTDSSCWEKLFQSYTMVSSKLKPRVGFGKGLEMSFNLMISLAACEFQLIVEGGVVFVGYRTLLYPTAISGNSVQFHLLTLDQGVQGQINPYLQEYGTRVLTLDSEQFAKMRCFLGWCTDARVNLGTERLPISIRASGGASKAESLKSDGVTAVGQFGVSTAISAIFGLQKTWRLDSHRVIYDAPTNYHQLLAQTAKEVALVYDSSQQRAWLVPKLSLLLHMSQAYAVRHNCPRGQVPFVEPHSTATTLAQPLGSCGNIPVLGHGEDAFRLHQLLLGLNTNLLKTRRAIKPGRGADLFGFEFREIIAQPGGGSCMKKLEVHKLAGKAWIDIANSCDAVVVCADLGDAITAAGTKNDNCSKVPQGRNYLAATVDCLSELVEKESGKLEGDIKPGLLRISEKSFWSLECNPFAACNHPNTPGECWNNASLFQQLSVVNKFPTKLFSRNQNGTTSPTTTILIPATGAVVFGNLVEEP